MAELLPEYFCELPRYKRLSKLRAYYEDKQYAGRADFFTGLKGNEGGKPVPLRERAPCIIYPLPKGAVNQVVKFTFGSKRFPALKVEAIEPDEAVADEQLSEDDAATLEKFLAALVDRCHIRPLMRRLMRPGLAVGGVCAILELKAGLFRVRSANVEDVKPTFRDGDPTQEVLAVTWVYQYTKSIPDEQGRPTSKRFWFRLDVDATAYREFAEVEVQPNTAVVWRESKVTEHGLGFCPVLWIRNVEDEDNGDVDGQSLYEGLEDEFDALNFALSQRHRGINFWGVPQPWESGVEDDDGPDAGGRKARTVPFSAAASTGQKPVEATAPARPISPANTWRYRSKDAKIGLLETTGKAFESASLHVNDIRSRALEAMSVVLVNVSEIMNRTSQGQMSAKFLELAYEPLLALVDEMRECWWPNGLKALLSMMLRMVAVLKGANIWIPGAKKAAEILQGFTIETTVGPIWMCPPIAAQWGDYFSADQDEIGKAVDNAVKAKDAGLVPEDDAARSVLPYFDRHDVSDALEELEDERDEKQALEAEKRQNEALLLHGLATGKGNAPQQPGPPGAGGKKPPTPPGN